LAAWRRHDESLYYERFGRNGGFGFIVLCAMRLQYIARNWCTAVPQQIVILRFARISTAVAAQPSKYT
jgi:hypothetical protein